MSHEDLLNQFFLLLSEELEFQDFTVRELRWRCSVAAACFLRAKDLRKGADSLEAVSEHVRGMDVPETVVWQVKSLLESVTAP